MKKLSFLLCLMMMCAAGSRASHLMGGDITVYPISSTQYGVKIVHYRDTGGIPANPIVSCTLFEWSGFPTPVYFSAVMDSSQSGAAIPNFPYGVEVYTYTGIIPATMQPGMQYRVIANECCRNIAIANLLDPGSESLALIADYTVPATGTNTSPQFLAMPIVYLPVGQPWTYNPLPYDSDGDSISWAIDTPRSDMNVQPYNPNIPTAAGYTAPPATTSGPLTLNATSGQVSWTPSTIGNFVASFTITEYKNGVATGIINRDMQYVVVSSNLAPTPMFSAVAGTPYMWDAASGNAYIYYTPGQPLQFKIRGADAGSPQMTMECISPLFMRTPPPTFGTAPTGTGNQVEGTLAWTPPVGETATSTAVFRLRNGVFSKDFTLLLKKNPNPAPPSTSVASLAAGVEDMHVFPNPASRSVSVSLSNGQAQAMTVELVDFTGKKVATLFDGTLQKGRWQITESLTCAPGLYVVQLRTAAGILKAEKVVVE